MGSRVGSEHRRSVEVERLRRLLVRLYNDDRDAFDAIVRLVLRKLPRAYKKVYKS